MFGQAGASRGAFGVFFLFFSIMTAVGDIPRNLTYSVFPSFPAF